VVVGAEKWNSAVPDFAQRWERLDASLGYNPPQNKENTTPRQKLCANEKGRP
jgi:hypothetical protein